jgi:Potato inhibitor I family
MGSSGSLLVSVILLFAGTLVAVVYLKTEGRNVENNKIVPLPQLGGIALRHGPWPGCLGLESDACKDIISSYAPNLEIEVITPDMVDLIIDDFNINRVRVYVDENDIVQDIPVKGR